MRIIQIGNYPTDITVIRGGVEASVYGLVNGLAKQNDVEVISTPDRIIPADKIDVFENIRVHYLSNPYHFHLLNFFRIGTICSIIQQFKANVVHIHSSSFLCLLLILFLRLKKIDSVVTIHGVFHIEMWKYFKQQKTVSNFLKFIIYSLFECLVIWIAPKIIVDTRYVADKLSKIRRKTYFVIPQGIDESFFEIEDNYKPNQILSIGSISKRKGHEFSILSIAELKSDFSDIRLNIIGITLPEEQDYYLSLLRLIKEKKLENYVFINVNFPIEKLKRELEKCYLFILHSYEESQGIVLCEAMAAGKPIVATQIGGIPDVVEENKNSYLVPFGDVKAFSDHIRNILLDASLRNRMGKESRRISYRYSWNTIVLKVVDAYTIKM